MQRATLMLPALAALMVALGSVHAQGGKLPEIKEIMKRMNKGTDALMPVLRKELQDAAPNWTEIQKQTKEYNALASVMEKNNPPIGNKDSWSQLTRGYTAITQELDNAAQSKDKNAALAAHAKLKTTCMTCHK